MNLRKFTSLSLMLSGIIVALTGAALFLDIPAEIVKTGHEIFSLTFFASALMHALLNIKSLKKYLVFKTPEFRWNLLLFGVLLIFSVAGAALNNDEDEDDGQRSKSSEYVIEINS